MRTLLIALIILTSCNEVATVAPTVPRETLRQPTLREMARKAGSDWGINPTLFEALVEVESEFNPNAISHAGAIGLAQIMPINAKGCRLTKAELKEPAKNLDCGAQLLAEKLRAENWHVDRALQRYNGGKRCINRCTESINHSKKVLAALAKKVA